MNNETVRIARVIVRQKLTDTSWIRVSVVSDLVALIEKQEETIKSLKDRNKRLQYDLASTIEMRALTPEVK